MYKRKLILTYYFRRRLNSLLFNLLRSHFAVFNNNIKVSERKSFSHFVLLNVKLKIFVHVYCLDNLVKDRAKESQNI